jgi:hypothetical protein
MEMSCYAAIAQTEVVDAASAALKVLEDCSCQLQGRTPSVAILYASMDLDHVTILEAVLAVWPGIQLVGCTTDGEFSSKMGYTQDSIVLVLLGSATVTFDSGILETSAQGFSCSRKALDQAGIGTGGNPALGLLFSDGLTFNAEAAILGFQEAFGRHLPLCGAAAADGWQFTGTKQFHGNRVLSGSVVFLMISGPVRFACAVRTGWHTVGRAGIVTRSCRNLVHEIDHKPAIEFFREFMGTAVIPSVETPIAVYDPDDRFQFLRTTVSGTDPVTGAVTFFASIAQNSRVRATLVNRDSIVAGARDSVREAQRLFGLDKPVIALCWSCAARRIILGSRAVCEYQEVQQVLGSGVPVAGFYGFGEISPPGFDQATEFHNESFVTLLLG